MPRWSWIILVPLTLVALPGLASECRVIADFAHDRVGEFPEDWRPKAEKARDVYRVLEQGSVRFVRATAEGTGIQIGREFAWDLRAYPVLSWRWRPRVFPQGADERAAGRNDSALGVYAVFPHSPVSVKTVKYVWSATAPAGATATASLGLTHMLVLRSGPSPGDAFAVESVDVARDYQRLFGEAPAGPRGIALLTDADDTKSTAVGDYADFRICPAGAAPSTTR